MGIFQGQNLASSNSVRVVTHAKLKRSQGIKPTRSTTPPPNTGLHMMAELSLCLCQVERSGHLPALASQYTWSLLVNLSLSLLRPGHQKLNKVLDSPTSPSPKFYLPPTPISTQWIFLAVEEENGFQSSSVGLKDKEISITSAPQSRLLGLLGPYHSREGRYQNRYTIRVYKDPIKRMRYSWLSNS